ncbi:MAG TPA: imidazole glycerol phosphate synthase subunit HisH, partial [Desulfobacterales bacterium]|nr:imidazole glycerol phosphate synthase subunit HisH [Desulfobacterales bacterium]
MITLLDYGAGNVRSVRNAIRKLGYSVQDVKNPSDILNAERLIFPGVGSYGSVMDRLQLDGLIEPLIERIKSDKPVLGICVALQALFEGSEESPGVAGLGILKGQIKRFTETTLSVPQIGWNGVKLHQQSP